MKTFSTTIAILSLLILVAVSITSSGSAQTAQSFQASQGASIQRCQNCCRPSKVSHFWRVALPAAHDGSSTSAALSALPGNIATTPGGAVIKDGKNLVITNVDIVTTNGASWAPDLVRAESTTGVFERLLHGTAAAGWTAGGNSGLVVVPDELLGAGLAIRPDIPGQGLWSGEISISGYWITN